MSAIHLGGGITFLVLVFTPPMWGGEPLRVPRSANIGVDLYGDPLPKGVIARLGSLRFRHPGSVWEAAFSPDGKLLAASSDGYNMVILWDRATGRKIREIALGTRPGYQPTRLRFSADGRRLYGCSWYGRDMSIYAWDVASGKSAKEVPDFPKEMRTLGYSSDGREMLLLHHGEVVRWDIEKGKELGRYPGRGNNIVAHVGERLLMPYFDGRAVDMWDLVKNQRLWSVKTSPDKHGAGKRMAFSANGKFFAVEAPPGAISVYESVTGKTVRQLEGFGGADCLTLGISPDGRTVAGCIGDDTRRLWDVESGRERSKVPGLHIASSNFFFSPDSKVFATGGPNNPEAVLLWDTATGKPIDRFPGHAGPVACVSFSPDGRMAATCSWIRGDCVVRVWETRTGRLVRALDAGEGRGVTAVAFSPDGEMLAATHWDGKKRIRIWKVRTGRELHDLMGHARHCTCVAFSPDGKRLASGDNYYDHKGEHGGRLCIWDAETGKLIREIRGTRGSIQRVLFTREGRHILAAADGVHVYDADSGRLIGKPFQTNTRVWRLALSADGRLLATADGHGGPARLWELATRREIPLAIPGSDGPGVALTADGRTVAASSSKGNVVLFHWPSGKTVGKLSGDPYIGTQVFFAPDGRQLAIADNAEATALICDVANWVNHPLPAVAKPTVADLRLWWEMLGGDSPAEAYKAVWRFVAAPEQALPFLAASLQPVKPSTPVDVARLIDDLDSDQFQVREKASRELGKLGESVEEALRKTKRGNTSPEQARRIDRLLAAFANPVPDSEQLRATRAVAVLEQIGSSEARKILTGLAAGAPAARLTQEAQAALKTKNAP